jgi:predicted acylesterase/phospholipase RssA
MTDPQGRKVALILSGGGANGAYAVGVLKALFAGKSTATRNLLLDPDVFLGTSIGSFNASYLVSHWDEYGPAAVTNLERVWLETLAADATGRNGGIRFRGDPSYYLNPRAYMPNPLQPLMQLALDSAVIAWDGTQRAVTLVTSQQETLRERLANLFNFPSFISADPWHQTIVDHINFDSIRRTARQLTVVATNWTNGELRFFRNHDMTEHLGPKAILASSAIPGVFPPVYVGAEPYVDGGVLMNTPLREAVHMGGEILHVIYMDPDVSKIPSSALGSSVATTYRLQEISWAALVNDDIEDAAMINEGIRILRRISGEQDVVDTELELLAKGMHKLAPRLKRYLTYKPLTIHRYHPHEELSSGALGMLNLDRDHLEDLIDKGFTDATLHDCDQEGCVLPEETHAPIAMIPVTGA